MLDPRAALMKKGLLMAIRFLKNTGKKEWKVGLMKAEQAVESGDVDYDVVIPKFIELILENNRGQ